MTLFGIVHVASKTKACNTAITNRKLGKIIVQFGQQHTSSNHTCLSAKDKNCPNNRNPLHFSRQSPLQFAPPPPPSDREWQIDLIESLIQANQLLLWSNHCCNSIILICMICCMPVCSVHGAGVELMVPRRRRRRWSDGTGTLRAGWRRRRRRSNVWTHVLNVIACGREQ